MPEMNDTGRNMYELAGKLFPICRSITGNGFRQSLEMIREIVPEIQVFEVPSGTAVYDWTVPKEWNIRGGWIKNMQGETIIDFNDCNLHVMGYSIPIHQTLSREELSEHVYTQPEQPEWIPYVTSYYKERWGFCMSERQKQALTDAEYEVYIDSTLEDGFLTYGELVLPGETDDEIFFSTYLCHPSMANNELSGPCVQTELIKYLKSLSHRRYTYRFVFIPETIGSITYLSRNLEALQQHVKAGFVLSCVGDNRTYSMVSTKYEDTLADRVLNNVLKFHYPDYIRYSFMKRASDERQYGSAGVDLPVCAFCRSKYHEYSEYHTSADNMDLISPEGLSGAYEVMVKVINALENNYFYQMQCKCEPQLGKRGLYPTVSQKGTKGDARYMQDFIAYADGRNDLIGISNILDIPVDKLIPIKDQLMEHHLLAVK
jgi:aminopeptidase-like protein